MDLNKAKILIEKINSLHKSMGSDASHIAAIEKDLMLSYIRQLYEVVLSETTDAAKPASKVEIIKSTPKTTSRPNPPIPQKPVELEVILPDEVEEIQAPVNIDPPRVVRTTPRVIEVPDSLSSYQVPVSAPRPTPPPPPPPPVAPPPVAPPPPVVQTPAPAPAPPATVYTSDDEEIEELFAEDSARELSEKLSNLPIKDLRKAMGLNEKIFTMNELFGGNQPVYDATINDLNGLNNFQEAKAYLIKNIAGKYGWTKGSKKKKAQNFIKLVRRRYA